MQGTFAVSDIDDDGALDVVAATQAYRADGTQFIDLGRAPMSLQGFAPGPAVADLNLDGKPEVIAVEWGPHSLLMWRHSAAAPGGFEILRADLDINGPLDPTRCGTLTGASDGGGPVTVGDFNGDGTPDVGLAGGVGYAVFDGAKLIDPAVADLDTFLWTKNTEDCSSAVTGSSLFDFNGDGRAEVVYGDEQRLFIYDGMTGADLFDICNTSFTVTEEPVIADVDNDGQADIVVSANAKWGSPDFNPYHMECDGTLQSGVRIFSSAEGNWVRTRRVWNQHSYHITNVEEDGSIPAAEKPNWREPDLNNFRMNLQPGGVFAAPDAVVTLLTVGCGDEYTLSATVTNLGASVLPSGVTVEFVIGAPPGGDIVGTAATLQALFPMQSEKVVFVLKDPPEAFVAGDVPVYARVKSGAAVHECRPDNNESDTVSGRCVLQ
jgi:hypothetical protein